jgi:hypothetical protein
VIKALEQTDGTEDQSFVETGGIRFEHPSNLKDSILVEMPKGDSDRTFSQLGEKNSGIVSYGVLLIDKINVQQKLYLLLKINFVMPLKK